MLKEALRLHFTDLRTRLSSESLEQLSLQISNQLLNLPIWHLQYFHLFLPIAEKKEINTHYILTLLQGKDKDVAVPRIRSPRNFTNILLTDNTRLRLNSWNIPEPEDGIEVPSQKIEVVFLPLLAFDKSGHRVGYGKGFYDTFLSECKSDIIKIGLSAFEAIERIDDVGEHDIALNYCVTPRQVYAF